MGLSELVLKVPEALPVPATAAQPGPSGPPAASAPVATPSKKAQPGPKKAKKGPKSQKTHSRESSGASNLSVRFTVNVETISTSEAQVPDGPKGLGLRSSDEDITLSDRLSQDLDLEDDDGFEPGSKSCESIPHDRLTPFNNEGDIR